MKRILIVVVSIILIFFLMNIFPKQQYDDFNPWLKENNDGVPLIFAHGGGKKYYPGNTMLAFQNAFGVADVLEMDVQVTKDDVLVLRHGENKTGNIRQMSNCDTVLWEEEYQWVYENCNFGYNFGDEYKDMTHEEWVEAGVYLTTLREVFSTFGKETLYNIEIKADADAPRIKTAELLIALIQEFELEDYVLVATNYEDIGERLRQEDLYVSATHAVAQEGVVKTYLGVDLFFNPKNTAALQIPRSYGFPVIKTIQLDNKLLINNFNRQNMAVHYWTINDSDEMRRLIELGADGLIVDDPYQMKEVLEELYGN